MNTRMLVATMAAAVTLMSIGCTASLAEPDIVRSSMTTADGNPAVLLVTNPESWPHDRYEFLGMRLSGDILEVSVRHGGGCTTHEFALLVSPVFLESYPVQMNGSLAHDAHGDPCRALVERNLRIDLSPIRTAYSNAYGRTSDTVMLNIAGWPAPVRYSF